MGNCKKCGISIEWNIHDESKCDFIPIDWENIDELTHVEDIEPEILIKTGYGIWELCIISDIMKKLFKESKNVKMHKWGYANLNLFNEAKKLYDEATKDKYEEK